LQNDERLSALADADGVVAHNHWDNDAVCNEASHALTSLHEKNSQAHLDEEDG
jgi:hypothetical protein